MFAQDAWTIQNKLTLNVGVRYDRFVPSRHASDAGGGAKLDEIPFDFERRRLSVVLEDAGRRVQAVWRAVLRDGARYLRQEVTLRALGAPLAVKEIVLVEARSPDARVAGVVKGSPIVAGNLFLAFQHPLA